MILPWRMGKWGRFGFQKRCTKGKTGEFVKQIGQLQVVLKQKHKDRCAQECRFSFLLIKNGGFGELHYNCMCWKMRSQQLLIKYP